MDHKYINEVDLVERYLTGRLTAEEIAEFEAHFVDCMECVGQLNATKGLMVGLRVIASEQVPEPRGFEARGPFWRLRPTSSRRSLALGAIAILLLALVGAVVVSYQIRRLRIEADQARISSAEWERRFEVERESSSLAEMRHQDSERDLKTQLAQLQAGNENKQNTEGTPDDHDALKKPQINFPILVLNATRGSEPTGALNELVIPRSAANFVISWPLEGDGSYKTYRATIVNDREEVILKESGLKPDSHNQLTIGLESAFFRERDYSLTVEGVAGDRGTSVVGTYSFRVVKTP